MPERMSEDMPERMSEDTPERMSEDMPWQKDCQEISQKACQKICQNECQKMLERMPNYGFDTSQKICQIEMSWWGSLEGKQSYLDQNQVFFHAVPFN